MSTYIHLTEVKRAEDLADEAKVGVCLTCNWWKVEEHRDEQQARLLSLCVQPQLRAAGLVVSGASGCNKWSEKPGVAPEARAYAHWGEDGGSRQALH